MASVQASAGLNPQPLSASPPTPLRMERGVVCEVTPFGLLKEGEGMPNGRRESYEAVPRRPEQQGTEGPALSMSPVFSVHLLPYLNHTLSLSQPSVTPRTCSSVTMSFSYPVSLSSLPCPCISPLLLPELVHLLPCLLLQATCLPVYSSTCQLATLPCLSHTLPLSQTYPVPLSALCYSQNLFICYPVFLIPYSCLKHTLSLHQPSVTPRTCSSVTLSFSYPVPISNIPCPCLSPLLLIKPVHLLPCLSHTLLLSQTYPVPYPPYPVPLSSLPCPYPVTKKVKPYSFTFFFFPLLSLLIRSRAVTTKTYFVCPP